MDISSSNFSAIAAEAQEHTNDASEAMRSGLKATEIISAIGFAAMALISVAFIGFACATLAGAPFLATIPFSAEAAITILSLWIPILAISIFGIYNVFNPSRNLLEERMHALEQEIGARL